MPRPPDQEPVATPCEFPDRGVRYTHPAFGQIHASRVRGHTSLYGSDFLHDHFVTVSISRSEFTRSLSNDWPFARQGIVEVMLSEAQWATFVSSLNVGQGVQCTINHLNGEAVPGITHHASDTEFKNEIRTTIAEAIGEVREAMKTVEELGLPKGKMNAILERLRRAEQRISSSLPFVADQFDEYVENTIEKAKVEANAYLTGVISRAGLEALQKPTLMDEPKLIEGSGDAPRNED